MREYKSRKKMFEIGYPTTILDGNDINGFNETLETALCGFRAFGTEPTDKTDYTLILQSDSIGIYGANGAVVRAISKYTGETITVIGIKGRGNLLFKMIELPTTF